MGYKDKNIERSDTMAKSKKEKTKEFIEKEKRNKLILIGSIALGLIIVFIVIFCIANRNNKTLEEKLSEKLTKMGEEFYTNFYYDEFTKDKSEEEIAESLSKFEEIGVKINLDNLLRYDNGKNQNEADTFKNEEGEACNLNNTKAIIYPKSPYGKRDYTIEVQLDCGFKDVTETE